MFLLKLFGSKKLIAVVAGVLAAVLVPFANRKLGVALSPVEVAATLGSIASLVLAYVAAQWHIDIQTDGETTTVKMLENLAASAAPGPVPDKVKAALMMVLAFLPDGPQKVAVQKTLDELSPQA